MNILVVDDETDMETLFSQYFRQEISEGKIRFAFASSGEEALSYLEHHTHEAVLILSDINMPGMSGLELLRKLKQELIIPPKTVMIVTAYGDEETRRQAMELGADDFITKPIDFTLLKQKLKRDIHG